LRSTAQGHAGPPVERAAADVVIVGGVSNFGRNLSDFARVWPDQRVACISTSMLRGAPADFEFRGPLAGVAGGAVFLQDLVDARQNYHLAFIPGFHGFGAGEDLWNQLLANASAHTISAYSRGGIMLYLQRDRLAEAIKDGRLQVTRIEMVGNGLATALANYLRKHGVTGVEVVGVDAPDWVTPYSTPMWDNPFKALALAADTLTGGWRNHNYEAQTRQLHNEGRAGLGDPLVKPGGVDLSLHEQMETALGNLQGADYDPASGRLTLAAGTDLSAPKMPYADFALALRCAYGGQAPRFSLDPAEPNNPHGPYLRAVYYGPIAHTGWGADMARADLLMKLWSCGQDAAGNHLAPPLPGFRDIFDLTFDHADAAPGQSWMRFWITVRQARLTADQQRMRFKCLQMAVKTERMYQGGSGALVSSGGEQDPVAEQYAAYLTDHYDDIARVEPSFARVRQLAAALALAQWMRRTGVRVDEAWLRQMQIPPVETPTLVPAVSASRSQETAIPGGTLVRSVRLFGGVDLDFDCEVDTPGNAAAPALTPSGAEEAASSTSEAAALTAPLPLNSADLAALDQASLTVDDSDGGQRTYDHGRLLRTTGPDGATAEYGRDAGGHLARVSAVAADGWRFELTRKPDGAGSRLSALSATGHALEADWTSGAGMTLRSDGKPVGQCTWAADGRTACFAYANGDRDTEHYTTDGALQVFERHHRDGTTERLEAVRDSSGAIKQVLLNGTPVLTWTREGSGAGAVEAPAGRVQFATGADDKQMQVADDSGATMARRPGPEGEAVTLQVGGETVLSTVHGQDWSVLQVGHGPAYACRHGRGGRVEEVHVDGRLWQRWNYAPNGRLTSLDLPSGARVLYSYREDQRAAPRGQGRQVTVALWQSRGWFRGKPGLLL